MFASRKEALEVVGGLSKPSKMPCFGYSLPAMECKTGAILRKIKGSPCSVCYAWRGRYRFNHTQAALYRRLQAIDSPKWEDAMVYLIKGNSYFRWHDSGDIQSVEHLQRIVNVALRTPNTKHWLPTQEYKMVADFVREMKEKARKAKKAYRKYVPDNLVIRLSATRIEKRPPTALAENLNVLTSSIAKTEFNCPASKQKSKCANCRKCWDKNISNIVYKRH